MAVSVVVTQEELQGVLKLHGQLVLLRQEVIAELLTKVLEFLLFSEQLLLFLLQTLLLALCALTAQESIGLQFLSGTLWLCRPVSPSTPRTVSAVSR